MRDHQVFDQMFDCDLFDLIFEVFAFQTVSSKSFKPTSSNKAITAVNAFRWCVDLDLPKNDYALAIGLCSDPQSMQSIQLSNTDF